MIEFRRYDPRDSEPAWELHEWAMREAGTDPADIPGIEDLRDVEGTYFDAGGDFLVGVVDNGESDVPSTFDGALVAMGGFMPSEHGHEDERTVSGAAELHRMRVAPPVQGEGYGKQLLRELERRIAEREFERIIATTAVNQKRAVSFYPTAGYREVDRSTLGEFRLVHFEKSIDRKE